MNKKWFMVWLLSFHGALVNADIGFESIPVPAGGFINNPSGGVFTENGIEFNNSYDPTFNVWSGFAMSNVNDPLTPGFGNQYAVASGSGFGGFGNYAVAYNFTQGDAVISGIGGTSLSHMYINNTTYTALSMAQGDAFTKQFGGVDGNDPDFFLLTIYGRDRSQNVIGSIDVYLADYRFADNNLDFIITDWTRVDLSPLGSSVDALEFSLSSSDQGSFGMNTPAYFAIDNLVIPEPTSIGLFLLGIGLLRRRLC